MVVNPFIALKELLRVTRVGGFFLFVDPLNWRRISGKEHKSLLKIDILKYLKNYGLKVIISLENLIFRELMDAWGNYIDWKELIILGVKERHVNIKQL